MIEGYIPKQDVADMLLDLRNAFTDLFDGYKGDVVVKSFEEEIDLKLKEIM